MSSAAGNSVLIELPFPSSKLSGQNNKHFWITRPITNQHREWALKATLAVRDQVEINLTDNSDIRVSVTFYPPDRRGDRTNYPNRMKPYWDGIADALCVNDRRFLPSYHFAEPCRPGKVVVAVG
jgi:hypothetical protein